MWLEELGIRRGVERVDQATTSLLQDRRGLHAGELANAT
jgi:hypothetical protein